MDESRQSPIKQHQVPFPFPVALLFHAAFKICCKGLLHDDLPFLAACVLCVDLCLIEDQSLYFFCNQIGVSAQKLCISTYGKKEDHLLQKRSSKLKFSGQ